MFVVKRYHRMEGKHISDIFKYSGINDVSELVTKKPFSHKFYDMEGKWMSSSLDLLELSIEKGKLFTEDYECILACFSWNTTQTVYLLFHTLEELRDAIIAFSKKHNPLEKESLECDEEILIEYEDFFAESMFDSDDEDEDDAKKIWEEEEEGEGDPELYLADIVKDVYLWSPEISRENCQLKFKACRVAKFNSEPFALCKNGDTVQLTYEKDEDFSNAVKLKFIEKDSPYMYLNWGTLKLKENNLSFESFIN